MREANMARQQPPADGQGNGTPPRSSRRPTPRPLDRAFRLSSHLTLALAVGCLTLAEQPFLPGIWWFGLACLGLLFVSYCVAGRWTLSVTLANVLAVLIAAGGGL